MEANRHDTLLNEIGKFYNSGGDSRYSDVILHWEDFYSSTKHGEQRNTAGS